MAESFRCSDGGTWSFRRESHTADDPVAARRSYSPRCAGRTGRYRGATIVRVVDELEKDGLIQRVADDADRRVKLIQLTEDGRALAAKVEKSAARLRAIFLGDFDSDAVDIAMEVLRKLNEKFQTQSF